MHIATLQPFFQPTSRSTPDPFTQPAIKFWNMVQGRLYDIKSPPKSYTAGLHQVWRHITVSTVLPQEEIPEEGGLLKKNITTTLP